MDNTGRILLELIVSYPRFSSVPLLFEVFVIDDGHKDDCFWLDNIFKVLETVYLNLPENSLEASYLTMAAKGLLFIESEGLGLKFREFNDASDLTEEQINHLKELGVYELDRSTDNNYDH